MGADQKRAILAVVLSGLILFGWQYFFAPPVENNVATKVNSSEQTLATNNLTETNSNSDTTKTKTADTTTLETLTISNDSIGYTINNELSVVDVISDQTETSFKEVFDKPNNNNILFFVDGAYKTLKFTFEKVSNSEVKLNNSQLSLTGSFLVDEKNKLILSLTSPNNIKYRYVLSETEKELEGGKYKQYLLASDSLDLIQVGDDDKGDKVLKWFGLDFNYHIFSIVNDNTFVYESFENGDLKLQPSKISTELKSEYIFAKKEYDYLLGLGNNMDMSVDFGIWSILAVPILRGLQFFFSIFPNYGISIIILTIIIRLLTFPLQYKSFKSMKKMQVIQPELTKIREKYKEDPQRMQTETMALFKKAGTNPLSGCLPMILQMPIFFAFYRVLYSSVELVDAPFYFWIQDLSEKDPFYVLPVLMGITMFFHQRLTPTTTMDPTQRKIMMFMPLIFAVFMKDFPAGLTLYIVVSTLVAMLQQIFVYKRT